MIRALIILSVLSGCMGRMRQMSGRKDLPPEKIESVTRPTGQAVPSEEMYIKKRDLRITPKAPINETGSLMDVNDKRNYLVASSLRREPGSTIPVKVASLRIEPKSDKSDPKSAKSNEPPAGADDFEKEFLKNLPQIEAPGSDKPALAKEFKMEVIEENERGDAIVFLRRTSLREGIAHEITTRARIPYERLTSGQDITTNDLVDVSWRESLEGQLVERTSSNWEDEFTARLSGFEEAKSKAALALADKQKTLSTMRDQLDQKLKTFSGDRNKVAKEREDLAKKSRELDEKMNEMKSELSGKEDRIKELEEQSMKLQQEAAAKAAEEEAAKKAAEAASSEASTEESKTSAKPAAAKAAPAKAGGKPSAKRK